MKFEKGEKIVFKEETIRGFYNGNLDLHGINPDIFEGLIENYPYFTFDRYATAESDDETIIDVEDTHYFLKEDWFKRYGISLPQHLFEI